jgi:acyl carrier protein
MHKLIAYVIPEEGTHLTVTEIRQWLMHQLPEYMLPSNIVLISSLPLTLQGKVNRQALLSLSQGSTYLPQDIIYATTPTEKRIAMICEEILSHPLISIHTSLYEVGMHSLSAMQIIEKINQTFGIRLSVTQVFETPTIASLAHTVNAIHLAARGSSPLPPR